MAENVQPQEAVQRKRPLWLKLYIAVLVLSILIMLFIISQLTPMLGIEGVSPIISVEVIAAAAMGILAVATIIGLWLLTRWGWVLAIIGCLLQIAFAVRSIVNGGIGRDYILVVCFAAVLVLFWRDRKIFT